jgi:hypothetical protein
MNICSRKLLLGLSALVFSIASTPAPADVLLNTISGTFSPQSGVNVANTVSPINTQESDAVSFSSTTSTTISQIIAFISALPSDSTTQAQAITLGIMADAGGIPSGTFLDSSHVTLSSSSPVTLNSLDWSINGGTTYWLTAIADSGTFAAWNENGDNGVRWAFTASGAFLDSHWNGTSGAPPPEAEIFSVAAVPEAPTYAMMILGFAGIGLLAYRRKSVRLRLT